MGNVMVYASTCSAMWPSRTSTLSASRMIKKAFTEPLKLRGVARGTKGDMKNINRYTNDMPTGRISEAAGRRNNLERKIEME